MKGQSFPLVPRDKRSFMVTRRLPNSLRASMCVCVCVCVALITCDGGTGRRTCSVCSARVDRHRENRVAEVDGKTLSSSVFMRRQHERVFHFSFSVFSFFFYIRGLHTDRD